MLIIKDIFPIMKQQYPQSGGNKVKDKVKLKKKERNKKALKGVQEYFTNKKNK